MSTFGTRLSKLLYMVMMVGLGLLAIGIVTGVVVGGLAIFDPAVLADTSARVNGQPLYLRQPELGLAIAGVIVLACSFAAVILWQLMGLLRSAAAGAPFVPANVRRLRILAAIFATMTIVQLAAYGLPPVVRESLNMSDASLDVGTLFAALLALVLAEVFRAGVALREDAEGTI